MVVDLTGFVSGFCDRLRQITFCLAVATVRHDRLLVIRETPDQFCPFRFVDLCTVEGCEVRPWEPSAGAGEWRMDGGVFPGLPSVRRYKPTDTYLSDEAFLELWLNSYQRLRPSLRVQAILDRLVVGPDCLGLHLRFTDKVRETAGAQTVIAPEQRPAVEAMAYRLLRDQRRRTGLRKVFLAADNAASKEAWARKLREAGCTVVMHAAAFDPSRLRQTSGDDFAVDLFALARCRTIIGTTRSGVVRAATWISGRQTCVCAADRLAAGHRLLLRLTQDRLGRWLRHAGRARAGRPGHESRGGRMTHTAS